MNFHRIFNVCIILFFVAATVESVTIVESLMADSAFECTAKEAGGMCEKARKFTCFFEYWSV